MTSEKLQDIALVTPGTSPKGELINSIGIGLPFFQGSKEFRQLYPTAERYTEFPVKVANSGDVLISVRAPVGEVNIAQVNCSIGRGVMSVRAKKESEQKFIFYFLKNLQGKWDSLGSTGSVFENLSTIALNNVDVPAGLSREAIGEILFNLDQAISMNNSISKTLEGIVQTIFKSWFIDFDPVKAKMVGEMPPGMDAATAALFPDFMEDSELGLIPKGWEVKALGDVCSTTIGGLWGNDDKTPENPDSYLCIRGVDMDDLKASGFAARVPLRWDKSNNFSKRLLSGTQILIAGSGAGPVAKSLLWDETMNHLFPQPVVFSNFVKRFECNSNEMASFVSSILTNMYESREIFTFVNGTSVPNLQDRELLISKRIAVPSMDLLRAYDNLKRTTIKIKYSGENSILVALRDSLLPRLISGELQIPEEMLN
jgi:type I restriction enzyme, S subunit